MNAEYTGMVMAGYPSKAVLTQSTLDSCESSEEALSEEGSSTSEKVLAPRLVKFLELSQINWEKLANQQEWRTSIQVRGLPPRLSEKASFEAFLERNGLGKDVEKVRVLSKKGARFGVVFLQASSVPAVGKLARLFHGRVFQGSMSQMPVSVCFASQQVRSKCATDASTEPRHVAMSLSTAEAGTGSREMQPGKPATIGCLPAWTELTYCEN
mmetsp:Transcript_20120/g.35701  ORF Transcript_20120/g.35701 Transcript_20120/m.35701 type:complete len:212 (+) Transcript_20120:37-672(+)|eukprot:CAMPEP_0197661946 /NCGR_PEP_ID=MMETSP1338-20131121/51766_1 /TAXON_ID=43686 ORGANISM="Pelagodinium beii, Strain RCC1491" /NCGR_SAMPLE_ID=MMETSP1338 /ASSEMBLY_ACC=CAM_ASM_000754 /LENGTH=211 /DNA_ID=CAMNT_0043239601 /DNA_START=37 /DNA_END=672 /DNA_ORIENTATION=+